MLLILKLPATVSGIENHVKIFLPCKADQYFEIYIWVPNLEEKKPDKYNLFSYCLKILKLLGSPARCGHILHRYILWGSLLSQTRWADSSNLNVLEFSTAQALPYIQWMDRYRWKVFYHCWMMFAILLTLSISYAIIVTIIYVSIVVSDVRSVVTSAIAYTVSIPIVT